MTLINLSLYLSPQPVLSELCDQYDEVLSSILDDHAPLLTKTVIQRPAAPWYNEDIAVQKSKRCKFERCWRRSGLQVDLQVYINQCLLVKELVNTAKANYSSSLIEEVGSDNKKLFHTIDRLLHRRPEKFYPLCESLNELSTQFNNFFTNKIVKIREELANDEFALTHLPEFDTSPPPPPSLNCLLSHQLL
jgi:hypothetical protein